MSRCSASSFSESIGPDGLDTLPGAYEPRQPPPDRTDSELLASAADDRIQRTPPPLAPVGVRQFPTSLPERPKTAQTIEEQATPKQPPRNLSQFLSLSGRFIGESLRLRDGDGIRRGKLESVLELMASDFREWSQGAKVDGTARTFLIRCRAHLGKLEKLRTEHAFIRNPLGSVIAATETGPQHSDEADNFLADIARAKQKVGEWITQAVLETDMTLRDDCARRLEQFRQQYGTAQQGAAASQISELSLAIEELKYLSEHSKKELREEISHLKELLSGR